MANFLIIYETLLTIFLFKAIHKENLGFGRKSNPRKTSLSGKRQIYKYFCADLRDCHIASLREPGDEICQNSDRTRRINVFYKRKQL